MVFVKKLFYLCCLNVMDYYIIVIFFWGILVDKNMSIEWEDEVYF